MKKLIIFFIIAFIILPIKLIAAEPEVSKVNESSENLIRPIIRIYDPYSKVLETEFYPFPETSIVQGVNIASGDINGDGNNEIIVAPNRNEKPIIRIFNNHGKYISEFLAYKENFRSGFKIIVAKLYPSKPAVIITAPNEGGGPHIRIFDYQGNLLNEFFAYNPKIYSGVNIAAGDVNNDGIMEIIAGSGYQTEAKVQIYTREGKFLNEFSPYPKAKIGVIVQIKDINKDHFEDIITAPYMDYQPEIRIYDYLGNLLKKFIVQSPEYLGGLNISLADIDNDKAVEIITAPGYGLESEIKYFTVDGQIKSGLNMVAFPGFKGGVSLANANLDQDNQIELITAMQTISPLNKYEASKLIEIDLSKQKLFAYKKGILEKQFIVSTGKNKFPTPQGNFKIYNKVPLTRMTRNYGPNHPENYDIPNVPHVMYFYRDYAIHGAYWHWKFGTRVSHGCVNLKLPDAKWLYEWAVIGTPVNIYNSKK